MLKDHKRSYFIDFEYAGIDDLSKLASDVIIHPDNMLNIAMKEYFIERLLKIDKMNDSWHKRMEDILPIMKIKWIIIMLNPYLNGVMTEDRLQKIMDYNMKCKVAR